MFDLQGAERLINPVGPVWSRRTRYANIQVRVPYRALRRFKEILPMQGAVSWFIREVIEEFNEQAGDITDEPHIKAVRERVARLAKKPRRSRSKKFLITEEEIGTIR